MIVRQQGGLTEFIPSPREKRDGVIRDNALELIANLNARLQRIETELDLPSKEAEAFTEIMKRIQQEETETKRINRKLLDSGVSHSERI
ncbi:VrlD [Desulfosarcina alkanivorans]|nr:VrlD [Desulfosarcina alkanivorans]